MTVRSVRVKSDSTGAAPPSASPAKPRKTSPAKPRKRRAKPKHKLELTPIRVHYNVGMGNRITVRGDTAPFGWDRGIDTQNTADDVWEFQVERIVAGKTFQFKPLINDATYSSGENFVAAGRKSLDIYPTF